MLRALGFILAALGAVYSLTNATSAAARDVKDPYRKDFDDHFQRWADRFGLPWRLVKAVGVTESSLRPRPGQERNVRGTSRGVMQILCPQRLNPQVMDPVTWPPPKGCGQLGTDHGYNIAVGARLLSLNIRDLGLIRGVATYNATSARDAPPDAGIRDLPNPDYVRKVKKHYEAMGGSWEALKREMG